MDWIDAHVAVPRIVGGEDVASREEGHRAWGQGQCRAAGVCRAGGPSLAAARCKGRGECQNPQAHGSLGGRGGLRAVSGVPAWGASSMRRV
jgi:hypothetical protein